MPAQWIVSTGLRMAEPNCVSVPGPAIATGHPRVHVLCAQFVSKYSRGFPALGPKYFRKFRRTAVRRSAADMSAKLRAAFPPMNPTTTLEAVRSWPVEDQLELAFGLWDQIVDSGWRPSLSPELAAELDRRLAAHAADPNNVFTWDEVLAHIRRPRCVA